MEYSRYKAGEDDGRAAAKSMVEKHAEAQKNAMQEACLGALVEARAMCGGVARPEVSEEEREALLTLERGVYLREPVTAGEEVTAEKVYLPDGRVIIRSMGN